jgi:hypothetical protein
MSPRLPAADHLLEAPAQASTFLRAVSSSRVSTAAPLSTARCHFKDTVQQHTTSRHFLGRLQRQPHLHATCSAFPLPLTLSHTSTHPPCPLQIQGLNKKGAQFFAFTTRLTDPISALQVCVVRVCCGGRVALAAVA